MKLLRRILAALLCSSLLVTTGCEFRDIDLRLFVVAMGVDLIKDQPDMLRFSFKMEIPTGDPKSGEEKSMVITQDSSTVAKAVRELKSKVDKELDFGHCKGMMYGEAYARKNIRGIQDWTVRRRDMQLLMYPAVAIPTAEAVLKTQPPTERIAGTSLFLALSEDGTESPYIIKTYSFDLARRISEEGMDPILPVVEVQGETLMNINRMALMNKEKVKDILSPEETKLFNLLYHNNLRSDFSTKLDGNLFEINVTSTRAGYNIKTLEAGKERIQYKVRLEGILEEKEGGGQLTQGEVKEIEKALSKNITDDVTKLLVKIRNTGLDPLGFGLRYYGTHWNNETEVKQWKEMYPRIQFLVDVHTKIRSSGYNR
ncbi:spore germination protein KC [Paenibacillus uliginis N3/975]|uniref:Spore germination protein KC n=1 Tax=Paenibacillus uliginis N3/975 TaxID=1313296 RepID=A0A1X7G973_9BACL|nr:Ger(x)C family spore germination protein [Paenibacillus uliginis]SMF66158.1 spore germination protein KC [Paenibacillus uliginis N3/975]